jgi:hypothetical protein
MQAITHKLSWALVAALALLLVAALAGVVHGGPLDPPGPVGPTQPQVEPRTPISSLPFTITQPGSYFLTKNLTSSSGDGITVQADNVTIDLNGFTLSGAPGSYSGISEGPSSPPRQGWTIRNGTITNWQNSAIFAQDVSNSTFEDLNLAGNGISGSQALLAGGAITVHNLKATGNHGSGISLGAVGQVSDCFVEVFYPNTAGIIATDQSTIRDCEVTGNAASGSSGISAGPKSEVSGSTVRGTGGNGISVADGSTVTDSVADGNVGSGIQVTNQAVVRGCTATYSGQHGIYMVGVENRIEGNMAFLNGAKGYKTGGFYNVGLSNIAGSNGTGAGADQYDINYPGTWVVIGTTATTTGPWANLID